MYGIIQYQEIWWGGVVSNNKGEGENLQKLANV